jgi:outer membrane protein TolC
VEQAKAGYKPSVQGFVGYGSRNSTFFNDFTRDVSGWFAGVQLNWDIWDGQLTRGRVMEARALHNRAGVDLIDQARRIELEVRTAYSAFLEAKEVLESQAKAIEWAEETVRLATVRSDAGTGTQLDLLSAQTALTETRTIQIQALRDFSVARARLERAVGSSLAFEVDREVGHRR